MAATAITATDLVVRYGDTTALHGVTFEVAAGAVLGVLGPNGAGKTTLIRVLATQIVPTSGRATVGGHDVVTERRRVQERVGVTGQYAALDDDLTPTENLRLVATLAGMSPTWAAARIEELQEALSLPADTTRLGALSGGNRRRIDLAAGILTRPEVVILDEPTTGLDPRSRQQLWNVVGSLAADGVTVLLTTQYLEEADHLADRVLFLDHGRIVADGSPTQVKARVGGQLVTATVTDAGDLASVESVFRGLGARVTADRAALEVTARVDDTGQAMAVIAALDRHRLPIGELRVSTASLDDAFHELTAA
jgi:oleandomycin transport system ATP-binding protein